MNEDYENKAFHNATEALKSGAGFPDYVFSAKWSRYFFFPSENIFAPEFVQVILEFLNAEGAQTACLTNMKVGIPGLTLPGKVFINRQIDSSQYMSRLRGNGSPDAWLFQVDKYVCASDIGGWCIYCEKENDVAVIALSQADTIPIEGALEVLQAGSIQALTDTNRKIVPPFHMLTELWKRQLVRNYSGS